MSRDITTVSGRCVSHPGKTPYATRGEANAIRHRIASGGRGGGRMRIYRCEVCGDLAALLRLAKARLREFHS